ncbi:MAG: hypothetical protein ACK5YC_09745, partial [Planctomyces sp.]
QQKCGQNCQEHWPGHRVAVHVRLVLEEAARGECGQLRDTKCRGGLTVGRANVQVNAPAVP